MPNFRTSTISEIFISKVTTTGLNATIITTDYYSYDFAKLQLVIIVSSNHRQKLSSLK